MRAAVTHEESYSHDSAVLSAENSIAACHCGRMQCYDLGLQANLSKHNVEGLLVPIL